MVDKEIQKRMDEEGERHNLKAKGRKCCGQASMFDLVLLITGLRCASPLDNLGFGLSQFNYSDEFRGK